MTDTILIGRDHVAQTDPIGFAAKSGTHRVELRTGAEIHDRSEGGLLTIAATGAGKGVSHVIPNVLNYSGSMIIIDIKGEIAAVTARRRREMGQDVYILNPFSEGPTDFINPFDLIDSGSSDAIDQARMVADLLITRSHADDPFWDDRARDLITGAILFIAEHVAPKDRALHLAYKLWSADLRQLANILAFMRGSQKQKGALGRFANQYIDAPDKTRGSIHSTMMGHLMPLSSRSGERAFSAKGKGRRVDLGAFRDGVPTTIYLTVPPHYLHTHAAFLRIWVGALLASLRLRKQRPEVPTLFVVDEAAQLGRMDQLLNAATLMRGYGLRIWTLWQSIAQIERIYGTAGQEFIDNASTVSVFGMSNGPSAAAASRVTGWGGELLGLDRSLQVIAQSGHAPRLCRRLCYLSDPRFKGRFDPNPFHAAAPHSGPHLEVA